MASSLMRLSGSWVHSPSNWKAASVRTSPDVSSRGGGSASTVTGSTSSCPAGGGGADPRHFKARPVPPVRSAGEFLNLLQRHDLPWWAVLILTQQNDILTVFQRQKHVFAELGIVRERPLHELTKLAVDHGWFSYNNRRLLYLEGYTLSIGRLPSSSLRSSESVFPEGIPCSNGYLRTLISRNGSHAPFSRSTSPVIWPT